MSMQVKIADITTLIVEAIVNAANSSLMGGGGVDGAIHRAAGYELTEYCRNLGGCKTGEAKLTPGYKLPARYVIHTVGPVWRGGLHGEHELLAQCYRNSLQLASDNSITSLAFPAISCGIYGFPMDQASQIAVNEVINFLKSDESVEEVIFACFNDSAKSYYDSYLSKSDVYQKGVGRIR